MKYSALIILVVISLFYGCSRQDILTTGEFTAEFADSLRNARPELKIVIVKELELKVASKAGHELSYFLYNAFELYKQEPKNKADIIQRYIANSLETIDNSRAGVDRTHIVPVVKDRLWVKETANALLAGGAKQAPKLVIDDFNPDLVIVYAEDSQKSIRYLTPEDLKQAKIERGELRKLACENLNRLLPESQILGEDGLYIITAGGSYESSLLLYDSIWNSGQMKVQGDIVVAIPTRDMLLVTGSRSPQLIEKVKQMAREVSTNGSYRLTSKLFVYRGGKFEEFKENAAQAVQSTQIHGK